MKTNLFHTLGNSLIHNAAGIAEEVVRLRVEKDSRYKRNISNSGSESAHFLKEFIQLIGEKLDSPSEDTGVDVTNWGKDIGEMAIRHSSELDYALAGTVYLRLAIWSFVEEFASQEQYSPADIFQIAKTIDPMLDQAVYGFSQAYVRNHESAYARFKSSVEEWSIPVVPLFDGIAILPLIGDVDTNRAQLLMEQTTQRALELKLSKLILDLSGVSFVDTMVAQHIFRLVDVLALLGVEVMVTGISPAIAQTCVQLNIKLEQLETSSSLQLGLKASGYGWIQNVEQQNKEKAKK
ncbi:STAS domain-containing protein [Planomicrobium sp. Y74]|uniref:STAS domain-containing protein n=1 Tax=Planomicrobium sp. Y74 TaxID=2478977 RepID=UPI000EF5459D|nr:STAS domain-containing protein [Planomicrobium sp. Y74]RLQ84910.1 STAS domain-containing protein [Planomicrobium sp. Y74]